MMKYFDANDALLNLQINRSKLFFSIVILAFLFKGVPIIASTYYVDSERGDDAHDGDDLSKPIRSLRRVNEIKLGPGDQLLFKANSRYSGQLKPMGNGHVNAPVTIGMYGEGAKPRFDGEGRFPSTVYIFNMEYVKIENLEITNLGEERKPERRGIMIHIKDFGTAHDIMLSRLFIHDVNGSIYKNKGGGSAIFWKNEGSQKKSRFDGLLIEDCHLKDCVRNGINSYGYWRREDWHPSLRVVVRRCLLEGIPGDGIVPIACDGALIEKNVMRDCPRMLEVGDAAAGIWPWSCDNTIIQFNEVSGHKAPWDGQGFDSDWNCRNTCIQYNYSHDNEGGFLLICNKGGVPPEQSIGNIGTIVRHNVSINDGLRAEGKHKGFSPTFHISGPVHNNKIYNNVIIIPKKPEPGIDRKVLKMDNWGGPWPLDTIFTNNTFYAEDEALFEFGEDEGTVFQDNHFYGNYKGLPNGISAAKNP